MASDSAYPVFQHYGTAAQRGAFTPSPAAGTQPVYVWFETDTLLTWLYDTSWHNISASNGAFAFTADITPSQITSNQNNYNPTGLSTATVLRLSSDASRDITGLQGGADGRLILIVNVGGFDLVLKDASGSSSAANQFAFDADLTLTPDTGCTLLYDSTASVWRCVGVGKATGGGGGSGTVTNTGTLTSGKLIQGNGTVDVTVNATTATVTKLTSGVPSAATAGTDYVSPTYLPEVCTGRLTTESGVPVSTSDRTAQGTIYFTPCTQSGIATTNGNITLYNGSALVVSAFTELSLALSSLTSGKNYDVFIDYNAGTPQIVLSAAWTDDTTRADALGTQSGIIIKSGTAAYRWVGTIRTTGTTTTEDSVTKRFVWNAYNQVARNLQKTEATASWTYSTASWRYANNSSANRVEWVSGAAAYQMALELLVRMEGNNKVGTVAIGVDSSSAPSSRFGGQYSASDVATPNTSLYRGAPGLGWHFGAWIEYGDANSATYYGANANSSSSGLNGVVWN